MVVTDSEQTACLINVHKEGNNDQCLPEYSKDCLSRHPGLRMTTQCSEFTGYKDNTDSPIYNWNTPSQGMVAGFRTETWHEHRSSLPCSQTPCGSCPLGGDNGEGQKDRGTEAGSEREEGREVRPSEFQYLRTLALWMTFWDVDFQIVTYTSKLARRDFYAADFY